MSQKCDAKAARECASHGVLFLQPLNIHISFRACTVLLCQPIFRSRTHTKQNFHYFARGMTISVLSLLLVVPPHPSILITLIPFYGKFLLSSAYSSLIVSVTVLDKTLFTGFTTDVTEANTTTSKMMSNSLTGTVHGVPKYAEMID